MKKLIEDQNDVLGNSPTAQQAIETANNNKKWTDTNSEVLSSFIWRLPQDLEPITYSIRLLPFIEENNFTTDGFVEIVFNCLVSTPYIIFNAAEIDLNNESVSVSACNLIFVIYDLTLITVQR